MKIIKFLILLIPFLLLSCEDKIEGNASLELEFAHKVGNDDFEYGRTYTNSAGNEFSLRLWRTYISEIRLIKSNNEVYPIPESYHLIEPVDGNKFSLNFDHIPSGQYKAIRFYLGIVGDENLSGEIIGDLDPSNNMAWNWTTGYKYIRMDGEFEDNAGNRRGVLVHIGTEVNLKAQVFQFDQNIDFNGSNNKLVFELDLLEVFQNPHTIDFEVLSDFQFNNEADLIGENYAEGFLRLIE